MSTRSVNRRESISNPLHVNTVHLPLSFQIRPNYDDEQQNEVGKEAYKPGSWRAGHDGHYSR
jgi:hypothetical protein